MNTLEGKLAGSKRYREEFVAAFLKRSIPFQIRTIRRRKKISQEALAEASGLTQGVVSRAEDPDYGNLTFNTVLRIAAGFDLAFIARFIRFSEFVKVYEEMSESLGDMPTFDEEEASLAGERTRGPEGMGSALAPKPERKEVQREDLQPCPKGALTMAQYGPVTTSFGEGAARSA